MKFKSRIDNTFRSIFWSLSFIFALLISQNILFLDFSAQYVYIFDAIVILLWGLIIWLYLDTYYVVTDARLKVKSGPFFTIIHLQKIKHIKVGKTSWAGLKFGLARKGIIIKYNSGQQMYVTPKTQTDFVNLLKAEIPSVNLEYQKY